MELNRNGSLFRLYLWGSEWRWHPKSTVDLCSLFWTCLFKGLLAVAAIGATGFLVALMIVLAVSNTRDFLSFLFALGIIATTVVLLIALLAVGVAVKESITATEVWQFIKGNYCPQIKLKD